ncbi:zinc finger domain-containing protein [Mycobacteroides abscessus]
MTVIRRPRTPPGAIWEAYADADIGHQCPNCGAAPNVWCSRPDGRVRRTPCLARITQPSERINHP